MRKIKEETEPKSCFNRASDYEMIFVLLGRDASAPVAISAWIEHRIATGKNCINDHQIAEARHCAQVMEEERKQAEAAKSLEDAKSKVITKLQQAKTFEDLRLILQKEFKDQEQDPEKFYVNSY